MASEPQKTKIDATAQLYVRSALNHDYRFGAGRALSQDWVDERIRVYVRYTLASLLRQTDRDFTIWLDCREGSEGQLEPYMDALLEAGVEVTFDRGREMLARLPTECSHVYLTRIDSDDVYAPDVIALIRQCQGNHQASQFYGGYVHDLKSGELGSTLLYSPPFYTLRFHRSDLVSSKRFEQTPKPIGKLRGHSAVKPQLNPVKLPSGRFCVLRHLTNSGGHIRNLRIESASEKSRVLSYFDLGGTFWREWSGKYIQALLHD
ncbi:MAG: hypothetical protein IH991_08005 [Planctomycetes bacterium]|nr:hypothetical protein [Planctomycetota bacterium]